MEQDPDSGPPDTSAHHHQAITAAPTSIDPSALDLSVGAQDHLHTDTRFLCPESVVTYAPSPADVTTASHDQSLPAELAPSAAALTSPIAHDATPISSLDPDDFYKSYRLPLGDPTSPSVLTPADVASSPHPTSPTMTSTLAHPPTLANGNDAAGISSHVDGLVAQSLRGPGLQKSTRSVSGPIVRPKGGPSVKDLKKRFDEKGAVSTIPSMPSRSAQSTSRQHRGLTESSIVSRNGLDASREPKTPTANGFDTSRSQMASAQSIRSNQSFASRINSSAIVDTPSSLPQLSRKPHAQQRPGQSSGLLFVSRIKIGM
ncbi:hypothetical protein HC256_002343 [Beauveria bassiana]|nr:hypothetical protein HC256_002343 [Beauveria bassiana]